LENEINRYPMAKFTEAYQHCLNLAQQSDTLNQEYIIVLKSIPVNTTGMIPNFRMHSADDVTVEFNNLWDQNKGNTNEIWFCKTDVQKTSGNLAGRINYTITPFPEAIEIVWYTSPRRIEEAYSPNFRFPFWSAQKYLGHLQFETRTLFIPDEYLPNLSDHELLSDARQTLLELTRRQENIDTLTSILYSAGAKEVSLEFIREMGILKFVDWDSDIEYEMYKVASGS
jgi:hypothetical protein